MFGRELDIGDWPAERRGFKSLFKKPCLTSILGMFGLCVVLGVYALSKGNRNPLIGGILLVPGLLGLGDSKGSLT